MARNTYPGTCYRCGEWTEPGDGHAERYNGGFRVQHVQCAIDHRNTKMENPKWRNSQTIKNGQIL